MRWLAASLILRHAAILLAVLLASCGGAAPKHAPSAINVYASPAAWPWLEGVYACAEAVSAVVTITSPPAADLILRLGEPEILAGPAFQIGNEDILVVTHRQSPVQNLSAQAARDLFSGEGDPGIQVWVYSDGEDVQQIFRRAVMAGISVSGRARVAGSPQEMSDVLNANPAAVGLLPRRWKTGDGRELLIAASVPVLAITQVEPVGTMRDILHCLQE